MHDSKKNGENEILKTHKNDQLFQIFIKNLGIIFIYKNLLFLKLKLLDFLFPI